VTEEHGATVDPSLPEVVRQFLDGGGVLEEITLRTTGQWQHEGCDFENPQIISLFHRSVGRTEGGTWVLEIGRFTYPIEVEDVGYFVERVIFESDQVWLHLRGGHREVLNLETLRYQPEGRLYCTLVESGFAARFLRHPYYVMAEKMVEDESGAVSFAWGDRVIPLAEGRK
jgi:uncharacterized protein